MARLKKDFRKVPDKGGRPPVRRGIMGIIQREEFRRAHPEVARYGREIAAGLIADQGGEKNITTARRVLLEGLLSDIQLRAMIDCYLGQHGILRRDKLKPEDGKAAILEAEPILQTRLSLGNSILRALEALGLEEREIGPKVLSPFDLAAEVIEDERLAQAAAGGSEEGGPASGAGESVETQQTASQGQNEGSLEGDEGGEPGDSGASGEGS